MIHVGIPILQYCVDVKSNMALYRCFKANASRFLGAAIVSFFDGTSCGRRGSVSCLRRVVDELKRTKKALAEVQPKARSEKPSMALRLCINRPPKLGVANGNP